MQGVIPMDTRTYVFCPRTTCVNHHLEAGASNHWYFPFGVYHTLAFGTVQRYRCRDCGKTFSDQTFSLNYYLKKNTDFHAFAKALNSRASDLFCARHFGYSSASMQTRVDRLARNGIYVHTTVGQQIRLSENLVADGLESYTKSKYFPNNLTILIGSDSEYLYEYTLCHFRRKGRMSEKQRSRMDSVYAGKSFIPNEMQSRFSELLETVKEMMRSRRIDTVELHTDENPVYAHAVRNAGIEGVEHLRTISTRVRDQRNPLRAVNYFDRLVRKDLVNHRRKSICFARDDRNMLSRFAWYVCAHNYFKPKRITSKAKQRDERHHSGVVEGEGELERWKAMIFDKRFVLSLGKVSGFQGLVWTKGVESPLGKRGRWNYLPKFALA
jgi:hypothetical protein